MTTSATAAVLRERGGLFFVQPVTLETPRADEVLVRVVATGICHTDMIMRDGGVPTPLPVVLGHEGAGVVEAIGSEVTTLRPGDPVVLGFNSCGTCGFCRQEEPAYCLHFFPKNFFGIRDDGTTPLADPNGLVHGNIFGQSSFATHAIAHERNAVKVPTDAPLEILGPLGCGIMTGAGAVMNALKIPAGASLAIFGTGAVGLSSVMAASVVGAGSIIAVDRNEGRLELARSLGATATVRAHSGMRDEIMAATSGIGVDFAIDTTANAEVVRTAADCLAQRGTLALVGASAPGENYSFDAVALMSGGRSVRGVVEGDANPQSFIPNLIDLHRAGRFPFERLVRFYPLAEINAAMHDAATGAVVKPIIRMPALPVSSAQTPQ